MNAPIQDGWTRCPHGELAQLSSRLRLRAFYRQAGLALAVAATAALSVFSATRLSDALFSPSYQPAGGACTSSDGGCGGCATVPDNTPALQDAQK